MHKTMTQCWLNNKWTLDHCPENTTHLDNIWPMLAHRLRRWPNIGQALSRCVVFAGCRVLARMLAGPVELGQEEGSALLYTQWSCTYCTICTCILYMLPAMSRDMLRNTTTNHTWYISCWIMSSYLHYSHAALKWCYNGNKDPEWILRNLKLTLVSPNKEFQRQLICPSEWIGFFRPHSTHIGETGPGEHPENSEMNEITLPSRHRIRSSVWRRARYLLVTKAPSNTESLQMGGEETFESLKPECQSGWRTRSCELNDRYVLSCMNL